ncbi:MAG: alpha-amylase [Muribaculaceae bacterium]|nr:alpha-amylase [Muribaculaceae bacterium]
MRRLFLMFGVLALLVACKPTTSNGNEAAKFELPAVDDIVMYQVNPRVFAPEKSLNAVAARIDSISDLGVNVMWVMPIYPIGIEKGKNSPYSIRDYKAIAPEFGTVEDFQNLAKVCHEHGMAIIIDWVGNHTAWDHPWVKEHPDWSTHDEKTDTIIHPKGTDWLDIADLNYDNADMRAAMIDAMKFWIVEVGLDGFRCDYADGVPSDFWEEALSELRKAAGERKLLMLAEGNLKDNFTKAGFDMNYAWDYKNELVKVWEGAPAEDLFKADKEEFDSIPEGKLKLRFTTNHDHSTEAVPCVQFGSDQGALAALVATIFPHGGALIYGSQEVGYDKTINFFKYVPVDWTAKPEVRAEHKNLISLYNTYPALRKGEMTPFPDKDVMAFEKSKDGETFLVLVNVRNAEKDFTLPEGWANVKAKNVDKDEEMALEATIKLSPYQYLILKK